MKFIKLTKKMAALLTAAAVLATTIPVFASDTASKAVISSEIAATADEKSAETSVPAGLSDNILIASSTGNNTRTADYPEIFDNAAEVNLLYYVNVLRYAGDCEPLAAYSSVQYGADIRANELLTYKGETRPDGSPVETILDDAHIVNAEMSHEIYGYGYEDSLEFVTAILDYEDMVAEICVNEYSHLGTSAINPDYPHYELLLMGTCSATSLNIWNGQSTYYVKSGESLDDQHIFFQATCEHGTSYIPLLENYLVGYDPDLCNVAQTVTMNYRGASHSFKVLVYDMTNFTDVPYSQWYYSAVNYVYTNNIMSGLSNTVFGAANPVTRGQFAAILYRMQGQPAASNQSKFTDVAPNMYYTKAVNWANEAGIVSGYTATQFAPDASITREQMAVMMFKYAQYLGLDTTARANIYTFSDANKVSAYATNALSWAIAKGLISGMTPTTLAPQNSATRAECAAIVQRFIQKVM